MVAPPVPIVLPHAALVAEAHHRLLASRPAAAERTVRELNRMAAPTKYRSIPYGARHTSPVLSKAEALRGDPPLSVSAALYADELYTCAYCGLQTISIPALRYLSERFPDILLYHPNWKRGYVSLLYETVTSSTEHIIPKSRIGSSHDRSNLVTACWPCQTAKGNWLNAEIGWIPHVATEGDWDGLTGLFLANMERAPVDSKTLQSWFRVLRLL